MRPLMKLLAASMLLILQVRLSADWPTFGHDSQRSGWAFDETALTPQNVSGLKLKWSTQLPNQSLALNALTAPLVARDIATTNGAKTLVYVAGSSNYVFALDAATGEVVWNRRFLSYAKALAESFYLCPNAINATPVISRRDNLIYALAFDGRVYGLDLGTGAVRFGPFQLVPPFAKPWSLNYYDGVLYTTTSQGCGGDRSGIYSMDVRNPMHHSSHELLIRQKAGAGMWNRGGTAIGSGKVYVSTGDGVFNPAEGDYGSTFLAVSVPNLDLLDYYTPRNWREINRLDLDLPSGGIVWFAEGNKELIAAGGKEGVVYLMEANNIGGKDHHTPLYVTPRLGNDERELASKGIWGSPAVWTDENGETWLYITMWGKVSRNAPAFPLTNGPTPHGSIMALKVVSDKDSTAFKLEPAWISPDFNLPDPPVVANSVVFALSTGENSQQNKDPRIMHYKSEQDWKNNLLTTEDRGRGTSPAVLKSLDARTGKLLYESGGVIKSWVHFSGLAVDAGQVYVVDYDSRLYCFGLDSRK
jgi:outer membrane protein assembly factor BamB